MMAQAIEKAISMLRGSAYSVALTGAGVSTPSGIPDFRSPESGLWEHADPYEVASIYAFRRRPQDFYAWIHPLARKTVNARPNPAHLALATMQQYGPLKAVVTQNIDMLHSDAGSVDVLELHGNMRNMTCLRCYAVYTAENHLEQFLDTGLVPHCACGGVLKPNVVLFGEQLPVRTLTKAKEHVRECDLLLVAGSSLEVAPACDLPALASSSGSRLIIVNLSPTHADEFADVVIRADVVEILPRLAAAFLP